MKRIFLIVLDSFGIGAMPDAPAFGDVGVNTLASCAGSSQLHIPNLIAAGLGSVDGVSCLPKTDKPLGAVARLTEASQGKDTTIGHWEIAGVVSPRPLPTYPEGFPQEVLDAFAQATGRGCLCNKPYSGTEVIRDYGKEHMETGKWIVYTSADSVFQVAAHEEVVPLEELYDACHKAREILRGEHGVGRVIARPFLGSPETGFQRTPRRHDYSLEPPAETMLDAIKAAGQDVIAVGKIHDIFAGQGDTQFVYNTSNANGMEHTDRFAGEDFHGLCFVNLVDFDMVYGHRNDVAGYAAAATEFDGQLAQLLELLGPEDLLLITADHGCDPATPSTDHSREMVPLLVWGQGVQPKDLGTVQGFGCIAVTVCRALGVDPAGLDGEDLWPRITQG